ncbi:lipoprotein transmembrane [Imbroritus primus]|jgi:hypothetical protein|uniref:Lipoprotein transmembrane n=1 Tax=Imbroritus primus TaxID=3058603 RepID=A0ACD3SMI4_9BURK|nr:lipoprotein transmembrane [Burkholderiaceae bacterium PBA]
MKAATESKVWWKEPWPWLLMAGPAVAMVGCGVTIWLAVSGADKEIVQGVSKQGLKVEQVQATAAPARQERP